MSAKTGISWTDATWNPVVGCEKVSQGCKFCYAKTLHDMRHAAVLAGKNLAPQYAEPFERVQLMHDRLTMPLSWREPRRIFVNSVSDLFHDDVPFDFVLLVFAVMAVAPRHTFQILTKRPARMREFFAWMLSHRHGWHPVEQMHIAANEHFCNLGAKVSVADARAWDRAPHYSKEVVGWPLPNVALGVSVENQAAADERILLLRETPAAIHFLSCEPLLGPLDIKKHLWPVHPSWPSKYRSPEDAIAAGAPVEYKPQGLISQAWADSLIRWVIVGGESGQRKQAVRPMHPDWVRSLREQCERSKTALHFKQWGDYREYDDGDGIGTRMVYTGTVNADLAATTAINPTWIDARGNLFNDPDNLPEDTPCRLMERVGTKRAGRTLDGRTWDEFPESRR